MSSKEEQIASLQSELADAVDLADFNMKLGRQYYDEIITLKARAEKAENLLAQNGIGIAYSVVTEVPRCPDCGTWGRQGDCMNPAHDQEAKEALRKVDETLATLSQAKDGSVNTNHWKLRAEKAESELERARLRIDWLLGQIGKL